MVFLEERSLVFLRLFSRPKRLACLLFLARRAPFSSSYPFSLLKNVSGREVPVRASRALPHQESDFTFYKNHFLWDHRCVFNSPAAAPIPPRPQDRKPL